MHAWRWLRPCLLAHGGAPAAPDPTAYLAGDDAPWLEYYALYAWPSFDELLAARHACGPAAGSLAGS